MTFLELYDRWMRAGTLPGNGLCFSVPTELVYILEIFNPTEIEKDELNRKDLSNAYWASGLKQDNPKKGQALTPLRQTIILLCAALNGEMDI